MEVHPTDAAGLLNLVRWSGPPPWGQVAVEIAVLCLLAAGLYYGWRQRRMVRLGHRLTASRCMGILIGLLALDWAETLLIAPVPFAKFPAADADAIVILGRGGRLCRSRAKVAAAALANQQAGRIFVSGRHDAPKILAILQRQGVSPAAATSENCSRTTEENARYTARILQPQGIRSIVLVSDPPHLLRSYLVFRSLGFTVYPLASPLPAGLPECKQRMLVVHEWIALVAYGLLGRYWPRQVP